MKSNSGFTLTELMVGVAIMGILAGFAIPAFTNWMPGYKMNSAVRDLYSHLQLAKMTAIKQNVQCSVSFAFYTIDGKDYAYIVFTDEDGDFTYDAADGDDIFAKPAPWDAGAGFKFDSSEGGDGITFTGNAVGFQPNGIPARNGGDPSGGVFFITDKPPGVVKKGSVSVSPAGSIRID